jgi:hypothetical protein
LLVGAVFRFLSETSFCCLCAGLFRVAWFVFVCWVSLFVFIGGGFVLWLYLGTRRRA